MNKDEIEAKQRSEIDAMIDKFKMTDKTSLTREQIHLRIRRATVTSNLALVLADVVNTLLMDTEADLKIFGAIFRHDEKWKYNQVVKHLRDAKKISGFICADTYKSAEADLFAEDCDWWYNLIRVIEDRTGDNIQKTRMLLEFVINMPSEMNMFNVKYKDFKRTLL